MLRLPAESDSGQSLELNKQMPVAQGNRRLFLRIVRRAAKAEVSDSCDGVSDVLALCGADATCSSGFCVVWHGTVHNGIMRILSQVKPESCGGVCRPGPYMGVLSYSRPSSRAMPGNARSGTSGGTSSLGQSRDLARGFGGRQRVGQRSLGFSDPGSMRLHIFVRQSANDAIRPLLARSLLQHGNANRAVDSARIDSDGVVQRPSGCEDGVADSRLSLRPEDPTYQREERIGDGLRAAH